MESISYLVLNQDIVKSIFYLVLNQDMPVVGFGPSHNKKKKNNSAFGDTGESWQLLVPTIVLAQVVDYQL